MIIGKDNSITLMAGDNEELTVGAETLFTTGDTVYLSVKENKNDTTYLFQVASTTFTDGEAVFEILPEHTALLKGTYVFDVKAIFANGRKKTIIYPAPFVVEGGVFHG